MPPRACVGEAGIARSVQPAAAQAHATHCPLGTPPAPHPQRGGLLPRGVLLSQDDVALLKAFDGDGDGSLSACEMDLAQAAFNARRGE